MINTKTLPNIYDLKYPQKDLDKLNKFLQFVKNKLIETDIDLYLFGSYAKGKIKDTSDFDVVLISNGQLDMHQLQKLKIELILEIDDVLNLNYGDDFDIKIYTKDKFEQCLSNDSFFETSINSYMYKVL